MTEVIQTRVTDNDKQTLSSVAVVKDGKIIYTCFFIELAWKNNQKSISCIPARTYWVVKRKAFENGSRFNHDHFEVLNVRNRTYIKWHIANYYWNLKGCMGPGKSAHVDMDGDGQVDVGDSTKTMKALNKHLPKKFKLTIINKPGLRKAA